MRGREAMEATLPEVSSFDQLAHHQYCSLELSTSPKNQWQALRHGICWFRQITPGRNKKFVVRCLWLKMTNQEFYVTDVASSIWAKLKTYLHAKSTFLIQAGWDVTFRYIIGNLECTACHILDFLHLTSWLVYNLSWLNLYQSLNISQSTWTGHLYPRVAVVDWAICWWLEEY